LPKIIELTELLPNTTYSLSIIIDVNSTAIESNFVSFKTLSLKCPCGLDKSTGECEFYGEASEKYRCLKCLAPYKGDFCTECSLDAFKTSSETCSPCKCNGNAVNDGSGRACSDINGMYV
jgi:hypothetical protein